MTQQTRAAALAQDGAAAHHTDTTLALAADLLQAGQALKVAQHQHALARERYAAAMAAYREAFDRELEAA